MLLNFCHVNYKYKQSNVDDEEQVRESGFRLLKIIRLNIEITREPCLSFRQFKGKKAIVNVQNNNERCLEYAVNWLPNISSHIIQNKHRYKLRIIDKDLNVAAVQYSLYYLQS